METQEIWKDIEGYEGFYQVSNLGRIKSLRRTILSAVGYKRTFRGLILRPSISIHGYKQVILSRDTKKRHLVHRLVATTFHENPENKPTVNHKWGIKTDNRATKLEWATYAENTRHAFRIGLMKGTNKDRYGSNHTRSIVVLQYSKEGEYIAEYGSQIEASLKMDIHKQGIHRACRGKQKTAGGFIWKVK